jgi:ATP-binding cassette, subfamily A (ABC1), member 3
VSGARQLPYWAGNYSFDLLIFYFPLIIFFIIAYALGDKGVLITRFTGYLVVGLFLFGFSFIGYSYLFSFIFQKSTTAYRFFPFLNLIFFYFLPLIPTFVNNG